MKIRIEDSFRRRKGIKVNNTERYGTIRINDPALLRNLNFYKATKVMLSESSTDLPKLITERALSDSVSVLSAQTMQELSFGISADVEFLAKPKRKFGNRPIAVLGIKVRVLLAALMINLSGCLIPSSREQTFEQFERYGTDRENAWLVDFDMASCFEFIDHQLLAEELLYQGGDASATQLLIDLLTAVFGRSFGLPQGIEASGRLSDTYLSRIERSLSRQGFLVNRYADDFRVIVNSRKEAFGIIEYTMEEARNIHLALAEQKINIRASTDVAIELNDTERLFDDYSATAFGELLDYEIVNTIYDEVQVEIPPDPDDVNAEAIRALLADWISDESMSGKALSRACAVAIKKAAGLSERIENEILAGAVEKDARKLRLVMSYVEDRRREHQNWDLIQSISNQERITPWHKVCLLATACKCLPHEGAGYQAVVGFARRQLSDRHETVRAEAAWFLTLCGELDSSTLSDIYEAASDVTRPGVAAVAGFKSQSNNDVVSQSIREASVLNVCAFDWGNSFAR